MVPGAQTSRPGDGEAGETCAWQRALTGRIFVIPDFTPLVGFAHPTVLAYFFFLLSLLVTEASAGSRSS